MDFALLQIDHAPTGSPASTAARPEQATLRYGSPAAAMMIAPSTAQEERSAVTTTASAFPSLQAARATR